VAVDADPALTVLALYNTRGNPAIAFGFDFHVESPGLGFQAAKKTPQLAAGVEKTGPFLQFAKRNGRTCLNFNQKDGRVATASFLDDGRNARAHLSVVDDVLPIIDINNAVKPGPQSVGAAAVEDDTILGNMIGPVGPDFRLGLTKGAPLFAVRNNWRASVGEFRALPKGGQLWFKRGDGREVQRP
jgi:hypothetical protein